MAGSVNVIKYPTTNGDVFDVNFGPVTSPGIAMLANGLAMRDVPQMTITSTVTFLPRPATRPAAKPAGHGTIRVGPEQRTVR